VSCLYIVIPAYNEEENISRVVKDWYPVLSEAGPQSRLVILNDGSKDNTLKILQSLEEEYPQLQVVDKDNSGHGGTVLFGYRYALAQGADFVFQTDSDGQTDPKEFAAFWNQRDVYDFQIGHRNKREDGISRIFVTKILKLVTWISFGVAIPDVNTPFRLMKREALDKALKPVPADYFLSNVILTVALVKLGFNGRWETITFRPRQGGENSINLKRILKIGRKAVSEFQVIKKDLETYVRENS